MSGHIKAGNYAAALSLDFAVKMNRKVLFLATPGARGTAVWHTAL
jgi:hypothetical protein